ncbi:unnamed protein product [Gulo gulo]|uniref:Uncharacterized protein n=1 Tax=Gulo gulo TaxID=48420 RepID=A0A9X9LHB8_GULGU|nr:unnamed protein product [Gulo gulo]
MSLQALERKRLKEGNEPENTKDSRFILFTT